MADSLFPHIKKAVEDFMYDQEGNIPRNKVLTVGSMLLLFCFLLADEAFAGHSSHRSHSSHSSHRSHSSGSGGHYSHVSHTSHSSHSSSSGHSNHSSSTHSSHSSHSNHSNHASHSNAAPSLSTLNSIKAPAATDVVDLSAQLGLTSAASVPGSTILPKVDVPDTTPVDMPVNTGSEVTPTE